MKIVRRGIAAAVCAGLFGVAGTASALTLNKTFENAYILSDGSAGKGGTVAIFPDAPGNGQGTLFFAFYTQNAADGGEQYWVATSTTYQVGQNTFEVPLISAQGGDFGAVAGAMNETVGTGTITFLSNNEVEFSYSIDGIGMGTVDLIPLIPFDNAVYDSPFPAASCPAGTAASGINGVCVLSGTLTSDVTLTNDNIYQLSGGVFVGDDLGASGDGGVTLTIEPGTTVVGATGQDFLAVARGNRLDARGTKDAPIVFTSADALTDITTGAAAQWGGLILSGQAPINAGTACSDGTAECLESQGEGGSGLFGGTDPNDNSGALQYVRVEFAGNLISDLDELNGIAFQGVGDGTLIDYVQVHANADDGVEFFGGTANARHLVLTSIGDDSLDWTDGWQGKVQYLLVQQGETSDRGIEADNNGDDNDALPRSFVQIANATIQGGGGVSDHGILLREGTGANITHSIVTDGPGGRNDSCLDIDQNSTFANAGTIAQPSGNLTLTGIFLACADPFEGTEDDGPDEFSVADFFAAGAFNAQLEGFPFVNGFRLPEGSALNAAPDVPRSIFGDWFDNAGFAGAVGNDDWTEGWTAYLNRSAQ